jgi:putative ABC transport system permease protein
MFSMVPLPKQGRQPYLVGRGFLENLLRQTALAPLRIATVIPGSAAVAGLMRSLLGLYATLRNAALQRKSELALRIAVGAERRHIIGQILRDGISRGNGKSFASTLGSAAVYQLLARIALVDLGFWMWMAGPAMLGTAVVLASVLPARRAAMVDPRKVVRQDSLRS